MKGRSKIVGLHKNQAALLMNRGAMAPLLPIVGRPGLNS